MACNLMAVVRRPHNFLQGDSELKFFIYRQTKTKDPCQHGVFGIGNCMKRWRSADFNVVLGIGGKSGGSIAGKLTWVGIDVRKENVPSLKYPLVRFDHVCLMNEEGPMLDEWAPSLHHYMFEEHSNRPHIPLLKCLEDFPADVQNELRVFINQYGDCPPSHQQCECTPEMYCAPEPVYHCQ